LCYCIERMGPHQAFGSVVTSRELASFVQIALSLILYVIDSILDGVDMEIPEVAPDFERAPSKADADRLKHLITFANAIGERSPKTLFFLVKMLADRIFLSEIQRLAETPGPTKGLYLSQLFSTELDCNDEEWLRRLVRMPSRNFKEPFTVCLATAPVLPAVWNAKKLADSLVSIGTDVDNPWVNHSHNQRVCLWAPIGLTLVQDGHRSTACGVLKREGKIIFSPQNNMTTVMDISALLENVCFDGVDYRFVKGKDVIRRKANSFELGCIIKIGQIILRKGICFMNERRTHEPEEMMQVLSEPLTESEVEKRHLDLREGNVEERVKYERREAKLEIARNMLRHKLPIADVARYTGFSEAEVKSLEL